jgi:hypothetical protein
MLLWAGACAAATLLVCPALARADDAADDDLPRIDPEGEIQCLVDGDQRSWRVQCREDGGKKRCVYAPNSELDEHGEFIRPLERARPCDTMGTFDQDLLRSQGFELVPGLADAPRGWMRDRRQRVFQVEFDLHKRLYLGVSWTPTARAGGDTAWGRASLDFGLFEWEHLATRGRGAIRHRLRLVEGEAELAPFGGEVTLLHYDLSRRYPDPIVRITTFFGKPRRHDIDAHIGGWFELGHLEIYETAPGARESLWRLATAHLTWDMWRDHDMYSWVRLRGGVGLERTYVDTAGSVDRAAVTPGAAIDGNITFDRKGFHHLVFEGLWEWPQYYGTGNGEEGAERRHVEVGYELIVLAVNDQPLTLRVAGEGDWRGDVPGVEAGWDWRGTAGLRFNLWAPAR